MVVTIIADTKKTKLHLSRYKYGTGTTNYKHISKQLPAFWSLLTLLQISKCFLETEGKVSGYLAIPQNIYESSRLASWRCKSAARRAHGC